VKPRFIVPEVIQTSQMGCAPAALAAVCRGFGIGVDAAQLSEELQMDRDGTSINAVEAVANQRGLCAEQRLVPSEHVFDSEMGLLPAVVVLNAPNIGNHLVVVWRRCGPWLQVMDPERGRYWTRPEELRRRLLIHEQVISREQCSRLTRSKAYAAALGRRAQSLGIRRHQMAPLLAHALAEPDWRGMARVDAALRMLARVRAAGAFRRSGSAAQALRRVLQRFECTEPGHEHALVPREFWAFEAEPAGVRLRGALIVACRSRKTHAPAAAASDPGRPRRGAAATFGAVADTLGPLLKQESCWRVILLVAGSVAASALAVVLAVIFRALVELDHVWPQPAERYLAAAAFTAVLGISLLLELGLSLSAAGMARRLEARLRIALFRRLPRIVDRYFRTRTASEMTERAHVVHLVRALIPLGLHSLRTLATIAFLVVGVGYLDPQLTRELFLLAGAAIALPLFGLRWLNERDLRLRTYQGQSARFYLESMQGLVPVRVHRAERAIRREHEALLVELQDAHLAFQRLAIVVDVVVAAVGVLLAAGLLRAQLRTSAFGPESLLTLFWAVQLPALGQQLAHDIRAYPAIRNVVVRLGELLRTPAEAATAQPKEAAACQPGTRIELENVVVTRGGVPVLNDVSVRIAPGARVAVVGASGAGKSTLLALLLGWLEPDRGQVLVDGEVASRERLVALRENVAWVDHDVRLWNQSLHENILYGAKTTAGLSTVLEQSELWSVLGKRPAGLATVVGEEGRRLSGGEGQRVRLARAWSRADATLVLMDEPFRGLSREQSRRLLRNVSRHWPQATIVYVTHDVEHALEVDSVLVMDAGRVVEAGAPSVLGAEPTSRFGALLALQAQTRQLLRREGFRVLTVAQAGVREEPPLATPGVVARSQACN
jgi:ATP-binding cassette subfamily B protein